MKKVLLLICCLFVFASCNKAMPEQDEADTPTVSEIPKESEVSELPEEPDAPEEAEPPEEPEIPQPNIKNDEYFNDSLFVGDSIMEGIRQYVAKERKSGDALGDARFVTTTVGITVSDLTGHSDNGIYYSYKGEETPIEDILTSIAPKRVFYLLGLNDLAAGNDNQLTADRYGELIDNTKKLLPSAEVIVIANPPKVDSQWLPAYVKNREFDNDLIADLVEKLKTVCDEKQVEFVDIHTALCGENGALDDSMCRDGYVHLNDVGAKVVVDTLYKFAEYK